MQHFLRLSRPVSTEDTAIKIVRNNLILYYAGFEVLTAEIVKYSVFCDITPFSPRKLVCCLFNGSFMLGLLFNPEHENDMFLQKADFQRTT
jgi:hypothetical protein